MKRLVESILSYLFPFEDLEQYVILYNDEDFGIICQNPVALIGIV